MRILSLTVFGFALLVAPVQAQILPGLGYFDRPATVPLPPKRMRGGSVYAIVSQAAARHGVPQGLAHAVIRAESGYNCGARNRSGAGGLGQLMPRTARSLGVRNVMSCADNANGAMAYLGRMYRASGGNGCAAATGYNSGRPSGCSAYGRKIIRMAGA